MEGVLKSSIIYSPFDVRVCMCKFTYIYICMYIHFYTYVYIYIYMHHWYYHPLLPNLHGLGGASGWCFMADQSAVP